jgi:antitoxin component of MazEF toxin-antitoxin module
MLPVPPSLLDQTRLQAGSEVEITLVGDVIEIKAARPRYTLQALLDGSDYSQDVRDDEWLDSPAVGREEL